jgi:hypothetical protein
MRLESFRALLPAGVALLLGACASQPRALPDWTPIPVPAPADVDVAVFLIGDAGQSFPGESPVLAHLEAEMETWAEGIGSDSSVAIVYLGDNIYPNGLHDADDPSFPTDSARLQAQIDLVAGDIARRRGVRAIFVAGNHDWGQIITTEGIRNLENQQHMLERVRERSGLAVFQMPPA